MASWTRRGVLGALLTPPALAQGGWPNRTIRLVVPFAPGEPTDVMGRVLAGGLQAALGQAVVVENRAGAGGNVGTAVVARAPADGYSVLVVSTGFVVNVSLFKAPGYATHEFAPITELGASPNVVLATPASGIESIPALIAAARATPGGLNVTNPGTGSTPHLTAELLRLRAGVEFVQVPHNSAGLAVQALLAGTTPVGFTALPPAHAQIKAGALRALALTGTERWHDLPDVPTMLELGYPGFVSETFQGFLAPAGTPGEIVARLAAEARAVLEEPATRAKLLAAGFGLRPRGPETLAQRIAAEVPMWREVIRQAGIGQE